MAAWICPACGRQFGRTNQSHTCVPAQSLDSYVADLTDSQRATIESVLDFIRSSRAVVIDAVSVGILVKRERTFAELRPKRWGMELSVLLSRVHEGQCVQRRLRLSERRHAHFVRLESVRDFDDEVQRLVLEAFDSSPH